MVRKVGLGLVLGMLAVAGVSSVCSIAPVARAEESITDALNVTIKVACTMASGNGGNTYNVPVNPGQTASDIGPTNIKTLCNDGSGYAIYAIGYSGDSYTGNNTKLIGTSSNINTGTSSTAGDNSYWAMKLSAVAGDFAPTIMNSFDSYHAVPSDFTMVAKFTAATDAGENAEGSNTQAYYEVKSSTTQVADTYTGKVKYVLVHPNNAPAPVAPLPETACSASQICYAPNASDIDGSMSSLGSVTGSATAGKVTGVATDGTAELIAPNYSREGYGFAGWSTEFDATNATNPVIYGPNQTITTSTTAGAGDADVSQHGLILYPVWIASAGSMQSNASSVCSNLTTAPATGAVTLASVSALTDERDDNTYAIAKLADGNCWMVENLRLNADDTTGDTNKALAQDYGGVFTGLDTSENANFTDITNATPNNIYSTTNITGSYISRRIPRYNNNNTNRSLNASYSGTGSDTYYQWYGYGNYYNWPAAIANTTHNGTNNQSTTGTSLCPTGWRLPTGGQTTVNTTATFYLLGKAIMNNIEPDQNASYGYGYYGDSVTNTNGDTATKAFRKFPNNFVYSGDFYTASASNRSSVGRYWSSTANTNLISYYLSLGSSSLRPGTSHYDKYYGLSIRCLASS